MSALYWQAFKPVSIDLTKWKSSTASTPGDSLVYTLVSLPIFSVNTPYWLGASYIALEFRNATPIDKFSWKFPLAPPNAVNFCLAVRYNIGETVYRYKLWSNVGEDLDYPLYNGEVILNNFVLEVWSCQGQPNASLASEFELTTSVGAYSTACCRDENNPVRVTLIRHCELFAEFSPYTPIPIVFDVCFGDDIFYVIDEFGNFVVDENGNFWVWL